MTLFSGRLTIDSKNYHIVERKKTVERKSLMTEENQSDTVEASIQQDKRHPSIQTCASDTIPQNLQRCRKNLSPSSQFLLRLSKKFITFCNAVRDKHGIFCHDSPLAIN